MLHRTSDLFWSRNPCLRRNPCLCLVAWLLFSASAAAQTNAADPFEALQTSVAAAERALQEGERQIADSRFHTALLQGWMIVGAIDVAEDRLADARRAFERAGNATVDNRAALESLALVQQQMGDTSAAVTLLTRLVGSYPKDLQLRRLLAQALAASGHPGEAVQELEEAHGLAPDDGETTFALASAYLRQKNVTAAERMFALVAAARPTPQTYVLLGRTYRDFGYYDLARAALERALKMDPRTPRAHYYLATTAVMAEGVLRVEEAIAEFRKELTVSPGDPLTRFRLGMALVEARRHAEALPELQAAVAAPSPSPDAFLYLGRCLLALDRPADAIASLTHARTLAEAEAARGRSDADDQRLRTIHYQLGTALRQLGSTVEAEREFAEAQRLSAQRTEDERARLSRYMMADTSSEPATPVAPLRLYVTDFGGLTPPQRADIRKRISATLARVYLNLGVLQAQAARFGRAAGSFEEAAAIDPEFPQVQYSLGVAYFSAQQYEKAMEPLSRALQVDPRNLEARRMLALSAFNTAQYQRAAELLMNDPQRDEDPSLQYMYGVALVRGGRSDEAEKIFSRLLSAHDEAPELHVVLGQALAQRGDYDAAVRELQRALTLKPDVADANGALGVIYLRKGQLAESATAFRRELAAHPADVTSRYNLATALDLDGHPEDALAELGAVLRARPGHADARYLTGKILLARGSADAAAEQLEIAARLSPDEANIHYQLGQAYQKLGRTELAAQQFEIFHRLKEKRRGGGS